MCKKFRYLYLIAAVLITFSNIGAADIKKNVTGPTPAQVFPDIWVKIMPYSTAGLKKGSVFQLKFKVFKNNKVNAAPWKIDLKVNDILKKQINANNLKFIPIKSREGNSYCIVVLNYTIPAYGKYKLTCIADSQNQVSENSEINNFKNVSIDLKIPVKLSPFVQMETDIILFKEEAVVYDVDKPKGYVEGSMIAFNCKWKRIGKEPPVDFIVEAYIDGKRQSGNICPKHKSSGIFSCGWKATPGYHDVRFQVEKKFGYFPEATESNNFKTVSFYIEKK